MEKIFYTPNSFIPNDVMTGVQNKLKIITAPNASGKTIYLKQVALLVYMTMIGSFVAANEHVEIGDFDCIFTRLYSNECIDYELSSFTFDLKQIADAVNLSTDKSLVIVDEFGKGTDSAFGKSIVLAIVKYWTEIERSRLPHVYLSTHFYDLFQQFENNERFEFLKSIVRNSRIEYFTFEFMFERDESDDVTDNEERVKSLAFMYKLKKGVADSSYALNVAMKSGLPVEVIERASKVIDILIKSSYLVDKDSDEMRALNEQMSFLFVTPVSNSQFEE